MCHTQCAVLQKALFELAVVANLATTAILK